MVPNNIIVPFVGMSFDDSRAFSGPANLPIKFLIVGQKISGGSANTKELILISNADRVGELAGVGSMAHRMAIRAFANNKITETYMILLDDAATSTAAVTSIVLTGTATAVGELVVYIDGTRVAVSVAVGDTAAAVGSALVAAVNAVTDTPVVAADAVPGTVTLTAKNKGIAAGDIDVRYNYNAGEVIPAGITAADPVTAAGTVDPTLQDAIDAIGDAWMNVIAIPYGDSTNLDAMETYLEAQDDALVMKSGLCYFGKRDTRANLITFAANSSRNSRFMVMLPNTSRPCANYELAAGVAAASAQSIEYDTAVPLHRMTLETFLPVANKDRWTLIERNQLAQSGIATITDDNGVQTESTVTMYLRNSSGAASISYQFQNTLYILMRIRYTFVTRINTRYARAKLANNADRIRAGQQVITPAIGKAEAIAWFLEEEAAGQVEGIEQFKADVICRRDPSNPNRLEWITSPDLINQFIVGSHVAQFQLESPAQ